jgi:uncharacterized protein YhaN
MEDVSLDSSASRRHSSLIGELRFGKPTEERKQELFKEIHKVDRELYILSGGSAGDFDRNSKERKEKTVALLEEALAEEENPPPTPRQQLKAELATLKREIERLEEKEYASNLAARNENMRRNWVGACVE